MILRAQENREVSQEQSNFQRNLAALLESKNLNANQLAQILHIPMMTIRRLLSGETTDPRISTLKLIADYFNVSVDYLLADKDGSMISTCYSKSVLVPIVDWNTAENLSDFQTMDLTKWKDWQSIAISEDNVFGKGTFALQSRPSMYPRFPRGTVFIIDPSVSPRDGDMVLVSIKNQGELTIRELTIDPPEWKLYPVVTGSNVLDYSKSNHTIVGVNILTMLYNRK